MNKSKILRCAVLVLILIPFVLVSAADTPAAEETPVLSVDYYNLSYAESTFIVYAVSHSGIDPKTTDITLLFWDEFRTDGYIKGTELYSASSKGQAKIGGKPYEVFYSDGIAPKNLTDELFCRAYAKIGSEEIYSKPVKYSALKFLNGLGKDDSQINRDLAASLRQYGAMAQLKFDHRTDTLANETFYDVRLENAHLSDGFSYGLYKEGSVQTLYADVDAAAALIVWTDEEGSVLGTGPEFELTVDRDITVSAAVKRMDSLEGIRFTADDHLNVPYFYTASPVTVEAAISLPTSVTLRGGVIFGNYGTGGGTVNVEAYNGGKLRLYISDGNSTPVNIYFDTDIRGDGIKHIAVTLPGKDGVCRLYVDGALKEEKEMTCDVPAMCDRMMIGGDCRNGNAQYFKGTVYSLSVYEGVRDGDSIARDARCGVDTSDPMLLSAYVFDTADSVRDLGLYGKDLKRERSGFSGTDSSERYSLTDNFDRVPLTYEALIETNADVSNKKGCTIIGNYNDAYVPGITFRVYLNGNPSLCLRYDHDHQDQYTIPVRILGKGRVHVAFSIDDTYVYGYLNGELMLKKAHCGYLPELTPYPFSIGGDNRTDNSWWFRNGGICTVNLFSGYRTAEQIKEDINRIDTSDPSLMLSFDFEESDEDRSAAKNVLVPYYYDKDFDDPESYDYTFACIGDTQSLVKLNPDKVHCIYDFILDNLERLKIERVIGLGDMTEDNIDEQWEIISSEVYRLDGKVPYTVVRGNHDHYARTEDAVATKELMFGKYFDNETYGKQYDGSYDGTPHHTYKRFTVCGVPYLLLCLDYGPDDDVLEWASGIVEQYPDDNVIIATHAFLFHDGTTIDENDICPPRCDEGFNNCDEMWDKFVSKHKNIVLVLCGHDPSNEVVVSQMTGENGNVVTCCLINPQHTDYYNRASGLVALLHFSNNGKTVSIEYFSTVENKFFKTDNEILIENIASVTYN